MNATERVNCPVCSSDKAHIARTAADIVTCDECEVTYLRTRPSVQELELWYQRYHSNPGSHMALPGTKEQIQSSGLRRDGFLGEVIEHAGAGGRLLDIGGGWGAFALNARDKGYQVEIVEICKPMAEFATSQLGIKSQSKQIEQCEFTPGFKVVTLIHTLEHLPNQATALNLLHDLIEPDGWLCGIVPNFNSFCSKQMMDRWPWLDANFHYTHYTKQTLIKALWMFGFTVVTAYTVPGDFYPVILAQQVSRIKPDIGMSEIELRSRIEALSACDEGEELRWFAKRL